MKHTNEIIERLENLAKHAVHCVGEPRFVMSVDDGIALHEAIDLLKEQEAVKPKEVNLYPTGQYACGFCGHISVGSKDYHARYCPECGRAVKWE